MAVSKFSGTYGAYATLEATWKTTSQSVENNTTTGQFTVKLKMAAGASVVYTGTKPLTIHVNGGGAIIQVAPNVGSGGTQVLLDNSYTIKHNDDGTKTLALDAKYDINFGGYGSAKVDFTAQLPDIARSSSVASFTGTVGQSTTIAIDKEQSSYTSTLKYEFSGLTGTIVSNTSNSSVNWIIPDSFAEKLPNATLGTGKLIIDTYSGSTKLGSKSVVFNVKVPESYAPIAGTMTLTDSNDKVRQMMNSNTNFVQIMSNIMPSFNYPTTKVGATIVGYQFEIVGKNQSTSVNGGQLGIMNYSGSVTIKGTVTDSRGYTSQPVQTTVTVHEYKPPVLNFTVSRVSSSQNTLQVIRNAMVSSLNGRNTMTLTFKVATKGTDFYNTDNGDATIYNGIPTNLVNSPANLGGSYPSNKSYSVIGILEDKFTRTEFSSDAATETVVFSYDRQGMGINKIREKGALDVTGDIYMNGFKLIDIFYPVGSIYESTRSDNPSGFMGGTWERFGNGRVLVGVDESDNNFYGPNQIGGEKEHQLTLGEMPAHTHRYSGGSQKNYVRVEASSTYGYSGNSSQTTESAGANVPHNNLQPYVTVYRWRRTA